MNIKVIFLFAIVSCFTQDEKLKTISWSESKPLTWADFTDKPVLSSDAAALTASGITFGFSLGKTGNKITDFSTTVDCVFYPEKSWYKIEHGNDHILNHEQLHFNITELHARKLRQKISELKITANLRNALNALYEENSQESLLMQRKYDRETNHSINKEKQNEWNVYVAEALKNFEAYKTR